MCLDYLLTGTFMGVGDFLGPDAEEEDEDGGEEEDEDDNSDSEDDE
jgi:hypothetical protein